MRISPFILITLFLFPTVLSAQILERKATQKKNDAKFAVKIFRQTLADNVDDDFKITKAPEKYKNEPEVMLCQKTYIFYGTARHNNNDFVRVTRYITRKRILLQEAVAVENFSQFYYQELDFIGIKVIKADGQIFEINMSTAIHVNSDIPKRFQDDYEFAEYSKIAIPNLEIGDIIDYHSAFTTYTLAFREFRSSISYEYPVLYQEIIIDSNLKRTNEEIILNTSNNAPNFVVQNTEGLSHKGKKNRHISRYILKDKNRAARKGERWRSKFKTEPTVKITAIHIESRLEKDMKTKITPRLFVKNYLTQPPANIFIRPLKGIPSDISIDKKCNLIYMHLKSFAFEKAYTTYPVKPQLANQYGDIELDEMRRVHSQSFAVVFIKHLKKNNIRGQVVAIVPSNLGYINNVGLYSEIDFGVYVPAIKKIFWTIDNFSMAGEIPIYTSDCNALIAKYDTRPNWRKWQWENYKTPLSLPADNVIHTNLDIIVNEDYSLAISSKVSFSGIYRKRYNPLFLYQIDPHKKLNYKSKIGRLSSVAKKREEQKDENAALKRKAIIEWLKENYSIDTMLSYTVSPTASILKNKALTVDFEFTSNDYLKKAGPNLIFNVGELITGQISLDQEEVDNRTMDIQLGFARKHINNIKIKLPEGTSIKGLEKLQMNVSNDAGAFVSEASQKGDILHIKTTKIYKQENIDKARWKELVEMLEAAYDCSQQKIILRKN